MPVYQLGNLTPQIDSQAWIAPGVQIIGDVRLEANASIWFGTVIRADNSWVHIGEGSSVQDGCVIHNDIDYPTIVESHASIAHQALLHGCHIGEGSLVGMQSIIMSRARIGKNCLVGAGSLVTEGKVFPDGVLIMGRPAKIVRELTEKDFEFLRYSVQDYLEKKSQYAQALKEMHV